MRRARRIELQKRGLERAARAQRIAFTFREYIETGHLNPIWGYYGAGRVTFGTLAVGFQTTPRLLSPAFGGLVAEQAHRVFSSLRLFAHTRFTLLECGAGDGTLARDLLDHARARAASDGEWARFYDQLDYLIVEGSPRLAERQREATAHHPGRLRIIVGNARDLATLLPRDGLTGFAVSNELLDDLGIHKVRLDRATARASAALCVPRIAARPLERLLGRPRLATMRRHSDTITSALGLPPPPAGALYLAKADYLAARDRLALEDEEGFLRDLVFHEIYVDARAVDELGPHLAAFRSYYSSLLAATRAPAVTLYVNSDAVRYLDGLVRAFARGRFLTIDYGDLLIDAVRNRGLHRRLMLYGPGAKSIMEDSAYFSVEPSPYVAHGKLNVTFTQDFDLLRAAGERAGLRTVVLGGERDLLDGLDGATLDRLAAGLAERARREPVKELRSAAANAPQFLVDALASSAGTFALLAQEKG
jgi:SAM-dependent MidA family methyltransferase